VPIIENNPQSSLDSLSHQVGHVPKFTGVLWFVDAAMTASGDGTGPHWAFKTIGEAIAAAAAGDRIVVKTGTYTENPNMNLVGLELLGETGATIVGTLTLSVDSCLVDGIVMYPSSAIGVVMDGDRCKISDTHVVGTPSTGFDVNGSSNILADCKVAGIEASGVCFDIANTRVHLYRCLAHGAGLATTGFKLSHTNADTCFLENCVSSGNATSGFHLVANVTGVELSNCTSGVGDGRWIDAGTNNSWSNFQYDNAKTKSITISSALTYNLFKITGVVQINYIHGHVGTALAADVTAASLDLFPTAGAAIPVTSLVGTNVSSAVAGSMLAKTNTAATALTHSDATLGFVTEAVGLIFTTFTVGQKTGGVETHIRFKRAGAGTGGVIHWHIDWEPISEDGFVTAV